MTGSPCFVFGLKTTFSECLSVLDELTTSTAIPVIQDYDVYAICQLTDVEAVVCVKAVGLNTDGTICAYHGDCRRTTYLISYPQAFFCDGWIDVKTFPAICRLRGFDAGEVANEHFCGVR